MFMELHCDGLPVLININRIEEVICYKDKCYVFMSDRNNFLVVDESYDTVRERIEYLCKKNNKGDNKTCFL